MATKWLPKSVKEFILKKTLQGNNVYCPCCGSNLTTFFPYGKPLRANASCPICNSLERHRLTWLTVQQENTLSSSIKNRVLHVAPEPALFARLMELSKQNKIEYVPCDKFEEGYKYPSITKNYDLTALPEEDESFDIVFCSHVLEHVPDDRKALAEIYRILKKSGKAVLLVPMDINLKQTYEDWTITTPEGRLEAFGQTDHVRIYGSDFEEKLIEAGFRTKKITIENFTEEEKFKYGLLEEDIVFIVEKES